MHRQRKTSGRGFLFTWAIGAFSALAAAPIAMGADATVQKVLSDLDAPCGVAVRPTGSDAPPYEVFVAESRAGKVVRLVSSEVDKSKDVITGFASRKASDDAFNSPGPRNLLFIDRTRLVVTGRDNNSKAFVRLYEVPENDAAISADDHKQSVEPSADGDAAAADVRSFYSVARTQSNDRVADMLVLTAAGDHGPTGLWKIPVRANTLSDLALFNDASNDEAEAPRAIAIGRSGYIVVASGAAKGSRETSALKFLNPANGRGTLQIKIDLEHVVALAYNPTTGNLYAANFATSSKKGGVYRLDDASDRDAPTVKAIRIADITHPTALAFSPDGALYVTALSDNGDEKSSRGELLKITGDL